ncbi:bestrophin family ion channel [Thiomonas sp. X19]|uniref:bestrophin family ion channel n=1 Tax=Thiomonas sp. X19 TaxID=1050370 RepID=UPI001314ED6E|nr:bestrophin family ion channel [Thiomonas sp. X19]
MLSASGQATASMVEACACWNVRHGRRLRTVAQTNFFHLTHDVLPKIWMQLLIIATMASAITMSGGGIPGWKVGPLRHQLRATDPESQLRPLLPESVQTQIARVHSVPTLLLLYLGRALGAAMSEGRLNPQLAATMDQTLSEMAAVVGGCERIANTPIPYTYSVIVHRTVYLYCFLLPFGLVNSIGVMTPLIVTFVAYTFLALDSLNEELEEPFGILPNDRSATGTPIDGH